MSKLIDEFCSFLNVLAFTLLLFPSCCLSTIRTRYTVPSCPQTSLSFVSKFSSGIASRYRPTYGFVLCLHFSLLLVLMIVMIKFRIVIPRSVSLYGLVVVDLLQNLKHNLCF